MTSPRYLIPWELQFHIYKVYSTLFKEARESIDMHFYFLPEVIILQQKIPKSVIFYRTVGILIKINTIWRMLKFLLSTLQESERLAWSRSIYLWRKTRIVHKIILWPLPFSYDCWKNYSKYRKFNGCKIRFTLIHLITQYCLDFFGQRGYPP